MQHSTRFRLRRYEQVEEDGQKVPGEPALAKNATIPVQRFAFGASKSLWSYSHGNSNRSDCTLIRTSERT